MSEIAAPPKWILFLLWPFKGEFCYPQMEGDLCEEFQYRASKHGAADACRWFYREVFRNLAFLTFRRATIAAIVLPLLCAAFKNSVTNPSMEFLPTFLLWLPTKDFILNFLIFFLLSTSVKGLAFGMICSALLRGHERMIRLVFTACYLGFWAIWGINHSHALTAFHLDHPESWMPFLGFPRPFAEPVWILAFIWYGSTWVERHRCRKAIA